MSHGFIIWTRGTRGVPDLHKRADRPTHITDYWKQRMVGDPIPLKDGEWGLSIDQLREIYPAPSQEDL